MSVLVRSGAAADRDTVAAVYRRSWRAAFGHVLTNDDVSDAVLIGRGHGLSDAPMCLVGVVGDDVVGVAAGDPATGQLDVLYVAPDCWGRGVGAGLLAVAGVQLVVGGHEPWLWVWEQNEVAQALYASRGWVDSGARRTAAVGSVVFEYQRWVRRGGLRTV